MSGKQRITWIALISLVVVIKVFSLFPYAVERYYSSGVYVFLSRALRFLFGWVPFSIGDIFYALFMLWLISKIFSFLRKLFLARITGPYLLYFLRKSCFIGLWVYVVFNLLWGLNYNRVGIASQLQLD